jgi:protein CSF1
MNRFDQSSPSQFDGDHHQSRNKLLYPGMKADFHSGSSTVARHWHASAYVDGFVLDLDPTIVDNVFGLVDVYRKGKERIDRLTAIPQTTKLGSDTTAAAVEASYLAVKTSNILVTLVFQTGNLHLRGTQPDINGGHLLPLDTESDAPDVIDFPTITVWGDYRATPAASKLSSSQDQEPSVLIFGSRVHRTTNRIQPSIFRFLLGFIEKIEDRLRLPDSEVQSPHQATSSSGSEVYSRASKEFLAPSVFSGIQLSFSLRIDSSRLELDCAHDLGVVAALRWESGGFLMTVSPRAQIAHFAGSVTGLEVDLRHLKHQAGTVQTAKADARNLAFSVSYLQTDNLEGSPSHSVSVVVDTEFGAALRFDRLQDILIFKAIYIDRLPGTVPQQTAKSTPVSAKPTEGILGLTTFVLVRARLVNLHVDLGHNVAAAVIRLESLVVRSRIAGSVTDLSVSIAHTSLNLEDERPLGGFLRLPDFSFATARRSDVQLGTKDGISKMLDVSLSSGALDIVLQSEKRTLLQYQYVSSWLTF